MNRRNAILAACTSAVAALSFGKHASAAKSPDGKLQDMIDIQCSNGNWNFDPYMHGMANGMLRAKACITGGPTECLEDPKKWLSKHEGPSPPTLDTPKDAMDVLQCAMQSDTDYAWSWHCNIACCAMDEGMEHGAAQKVAARFMMLAFKVNTKTDIPAGHVRNRHLFGIDDA